MDGAAPGRSFPPSDFASLSGGDERVPPLAHPTGRAIECAVDRELTVSNVSQRRIDSTQTPHASAARVPQTSVGFIVACAVLPLAMACATFAPKPLPPQVALEGIRFTRLSPLDTRLAFTLAIRNPNGYELQLSAFEATVDVEGSRLLAGALAAPVDLPAGAETTVEMEARTDYLSIASAIDRFIRLRTVHYEIAGNATVQDGLRLPFARRGEIPTAGLLGGTP